MLVTCRLAGLSALEAYYAGVDANAQMLDRPARPGATAMMRIILMLLLAVIIVAVLRIARAIVVGLCH